MVGQERKELAKTLHLSETQVRMTTWCLFVFCLSAREFESLDYCSCAHICMVMAIIITRLLSNISSFMQIILDGSGSTMQVIMIALHLSPSQCHKPGDDSFIPLCPRFSLASFSLTRPSDWPGPSYLSPLIVVMKTSHIAHQGAPRSGAQS